MIFINKYNNFTKQNLTNDNINQIIDLLLIFQFFIYLLLKIIQIFPAFHKINQ